MQRRGREVEEVESPPAPSVPVSSRVGLQEPLRPLHLDHTGTATFINRLYIASARPTKRLGGAGERLERPEPSRKGRLA
jgi:hypothetical protein